MTDTSLWDTLVANQGKVYTTSGRGKRVGVSFTYRIRTSTRTGRPSGELFIESVGSTESNVSTDTQWSSKSITRATVELAYRNALKVQTVEGCVRGPKKLGTFGASYLYAVFIGTGLIRGREDHSTPVDHSRLDSYDHSAADEHSIRDADAHTQLSIFTQDKQKKEDGMDEERVEGQEMEQEQSDEKKRIRRSSDQIRADKIAVLEEKIAKKEAQLNELKEELAELKRPPKLSAREVQALLQSKIDDGSLSENEAYQLGWKG